MLELIGGAVVGITLGSMLWWGGWYLLAVVSYMVGE